MNWLVSHFVINSTSLEKLSWILKKEITEWNGLSTNRSTACPLKWFPGQLMVKWKLMDRISLSLTLSKRTKVEITAENPKNREMRSSYHLYRQKLMAINWYLATNVVGRGTERDRVTERQSETEGVKEIKTER